MTQEEHESIINDRLQIILNLLPHSHWGWWGSLYTGPIEDAKPILRQDGLHFNKHCHRLL